MPPRKGKAPLPKQPPEQKSFSREELLKLRLTHDIEVKAWVRFYAGALANSRTSEYAASVADLGVQDLRERCGRGPKVPR